MKIDEVKRYEVAVDLYKHYNEVLIKSVAFVYVGMAGLIAFYLANYDVDNIVIIKYLAGCAAAISSVLLFLSSALIRNFDQEIECLARGLKLSFIPSVKPLYWFLKINAVSMAGVLWLILKFLD